MIYSTPCTSLHLPPTSNLNSSRRELHTYSGFYDTLDLRVIREQVREQREVKHHWLSPRGDGELDTGSVANQGNAA